MNGTNQPTPPPPPPPTAAAAAEKICESERERGRGGETAGATDANFWLWLCCDERQNAQVFFKQIKKKIHHFHAFARIRWRSQTLLSPPLFAFLVISIALRVVRALEC